MSILFIILMFIPLILAGILKMWALFLVFLTFDIIFGLTEWLLKKFTGKTVSQHFWEYKKKNPGKAIAILVGMAIMWGSLIAHLGFHFGG